MRTPERKRLQRPTKVKTIRGSSTEADDVVEAARRESCRIIRIKGSGIGRFNRATGGGVDAGEALA